MALALLLIGALLVTSGIRGTYPQLGALLANDFAGAGSFWYFVFGIAIVGLLGNAREFQTLSRLIIVLIIVVFLLSNGVFWGNLQSALQNVQTTPSKPVQTTSNAAPLGSAGPGAPQVQSDGTTTVPNTPGNPSGTQSPVTVPGIWSGGML